MADEKRAREIVNQYEDEHQHIRGYYTRTDLLAVTKRALREAAESSKAKEGQTAPALSQKVTDYLKAIETDKYHYAGVMIPCEVLLELITFCRPDRHRKRHLRRKSDASQFAVDSARVAEMDRDRAR
jgi:hypothetical protein